MDENPIKRFDRQIRALGLDAQKRLGESSLLLLRLDTFSAEFAKVLGLSGVKVYLWKQAEVCKMDLGRLFNYTVNITSGVCNQDDVTYRLANQELTLEIVADALAGLGVTVSLIDNLSSLTPTLVLSGTVLPNYPFLEAHELHLLSNQTLVGSFVAKRNEVSGILEKLMKSHNLIKQLDSNGLRMSTLSVNVGIVAHLAMSVCIDGSACWNWVVIDKTTLEATVEQPDGIIADTLKVEVIDIID